LLEGLSNRLTVESLADVQAYLAAGEYGLALETVADWLSEGELPITDAERGEFAALAGQMSSDTIGRIARALDY
jgi:hypothetical protein